MKTISDNNRQGIGRRFGIVAKCLLSVILYVVATAAASALQLDEVVVTAQKRAENLQDVPVAVSAITADQLADIGFNDIGDIAAQVPSLIVLANLSPMSATFRIRNIGNAGNIPTFEPATGLFIDGAFRARSGIGLGDIVDVQAIEVLKGPQSTLYGKNVTAGVISVYTQPPTPTFEAMAEFNMGTEDLRQFKGYVSGPITQRILGRLSVVDTRRGELTDNVAGPDSDNQKSYAIRGQLLFDISDRVSSRLIVGYSNKDMRTQTGDVFLSEAVRQTILDAGGSVSIPNNSRDRKVENSGNIGFEADIYDVILSVEYAADRWTFNSITSYDEYDSLNAIHDVEQQSLRIAEFNDTQRGDTFSQELRFASNGGGSLNWLAGAFFYTNTFERGDDKLPEFIALEDIEAYGSAVAAQLVAGGVLPLGALSLPILGATGDRGDYDIALDTRSFGVFAKLDYWLSENWQVATGLRYSYEEKTGKVVQTTRLSSAGCFPPLNTNLICTVTPDGNNFRQSDSFDAVTGSISSSYFIGPDSMVYLSISTGFKAGGYSLQNGQAEDFQRPFGEEKVINYEIGAKTEFWNRRVRLNTAIFHTEYKDFQSASFAGLVFIVNNADSVTSDGIEVDSLIILSPSLALTLNAAYIDTSYDKYTGGQCFYGREPDNEFGQCDLSGETLPTAIKWRGNAALNWKRPLGQGELYSRLDYLYSGKTNSNASLDPIFDNDAYGLTNLRLGWRNDRFDIALWGNNLTDEVVVIQSAPANIHTAIDRVLDSPVGSYQEFIGPPRTFGLTTRLYF